MLARRDGAAVIYVDFDGFVRIAQRVDLIPPVDLNELPAAKREHLVQLHGALDGSEDPVADIRRWAGYDADTECPFSEVSCVESVCSCPGFKPENCA